MITKQEYIDALRVITQYRDQKADELKEASDNVKKYNLVGPKGKISSVKMSTRLRNALLANTSRLKLTAGLQGPMSEFEGVHLGKISRLNNVGSGCLEEFKMICLVNGINIAL